MSDVQVFARSQAYRDNYDKIKWGVVPKGRSCGGTCVSCEPYGAVGMLGSMAFPSQFITGVTADEVLDEMDRQTGTGRGRG